MKVFHHIDHLRGAIEPCAVAIGNFDGCHLGHQQLLRQMQGYANSRGLRSAVLTFYPHPVEVLNPRKPLERLTTTSEKLFELERLDVEYVLVAPFDRALANLSADEFFGTYLKGMQARSLHVGSDFHFGRDRAGDITKLRQLAEPCGIEVHVMPPFDLDGTRVSSTVIRNMVRQGDVRKAAEYLGRPYSLSGVVSKGDQRGRDLGFPTANLKVAEDKLYPNVGVYVTRTVWQKQRFRSVTNVGFRPTFAEAATARPTVEVHFLDLSARLYDENLRVEFLERIREEKKFSSREALIAQIQNDVACARDYDRFDD